MVLAFLILLNTAIQIMNIFYSVYHSVRSVMHKHLEKMNEVTFDKVFNQRLGEFYYSVHNK